MTMTFKRPTYCGTPWSDDMLFDVALVDSAICDSSRGKAAGLDNLTAAALTAQSSNFATDTDETVQHNVKVWLSTGWLRVELDCTVT